MKKLAMLIAGAFLLMNAAFAGGILTNTNQSAQFVRMLSRNASTDLDAVYFNPAGLTQMENGFYFGLNNQSIWQTRTINSEFPLLNIHDYKGETSVPVFPSAFAVYKLDKLAFSAGFGPNGGGGTAKYGTGLPSFEKLISSIPALLSSNGVPTSKYSTAISFEGSSVIWGGQLNGSYAINEMISVSAGVRILSAKNAYSGYLKDIKINSSNPASGNYGFDGTLRSASSVFSVLSGASTSTANSLQPIIDLGAGGYTLDQLKAAGKLTATQVALLSGSLGSTYNASMTASQVQSAYNAKALYLSGQSAATADKEVDTEQTGMGFTPIIGVDITLDKLNIGLKYEFQTAINLTNATKVDGTGLFPNDGKSRSDLPAILAAGADYKITDKLKASGSYNLYFDKNVDWTKNVYGQTRTIDKNYVELALGLEYKLTDKFAVSAGYMNSNTGVSEQYQSDFSYSNDSYTLGLGFQWKLTEKLVLDAGVLNTTYKDATKAFTDPTFGKYNETYGKTTFDFAIGIGYKIF